MAGAFGQIKGALACKKSPTCEDGSTTQHRKMGAFFAIGAPWHMGVGQEWGAHCHVTSKCQGTANNHTNSWCCFRQLLHHGFEGVFVLAIRDFAFYTVRCPLCKQRLFPSSTGCWFHQLLHHKFWGYVFFIGVFVCVCDALILSCMVFMVLCGTHLFGHDCNRGILVSRLLHHVLMELDALLFYRCPGRVVLLVVGTPKCLLACYP